MRIALVTNTFLPLTGGGEFVVHHLGNQWRMQGHDVCVFNSLTAEVAHPEALYKVMRYKVMRGATRFGYHRFPWVNVSTRSLNRQINNFNPDFVSGHFSIPVALYLDNLKPKRIWSITSHGSDIVRNDVNSQRDQYDIDNKLANSLNNANSVIAISNSAKANLLDIGVKPSLIRVIPNGVELDRFKTKANTNIREMFNIPEHKKLVLTVGRNSLVKNLELGINAVAEIAKSRSDIHYLIVGGGTSQLNETIINRGLRDTITTCENLAGESLVAAYQQSDIFLSTSNYECCPLVILEAMASGLPIVATQVAGNVDLIDNEVNGLLVERNNHMHIVNAITMLIADKRLCHSISTTNYDKVSDYSWDTVSRSYLELLQ